MSVSLCCAHTQRIFLNFLTADWLADLPSFYIMHEILIPKINIGFSTKFYQGLSKLHIRFSRLILKQRIFLSSFDFQYTYCCTVVIIGEDLIRRERDRERERLSGEVTVHNLDFFFMFTEAAFINSDTVKYSYSLK